MAPNNKSLTARCPECDARIYLQRRPEAGELMSCPECDTLLEVISVSPLRLDWADDEPLESPGNWTDDDFFNDRDEDFGDDFEFEDDDY
ncbi:MAG: hypothetical protein R3C44_04535 [Chloroflexota bacterium]